MFATVRFGEDESRIFNTNCRIDVLLQYIRSTCRCAISDEVDVSDERGVVKNLRKNPQDYAVDHLKDRETLILLKVANSRNPSCNGDGTKFVPLLAKLSADPAFIAALHTFQGLDSVTMADVPLPTSGTSPSQTAEPEVTKVKGKNGTTKDGNKKQPAKRAAKGNTKKGSSS